MDRILVAQELMKVAKDLMAIEFPTQDAYDKYMKEHPDADKSMHTIKKTEQKTPAKKEESKESPHLKGALEHLSKLSDALKHIPKAAKHMAGLKYFINKATNADASGVKGHCEAAQRALKDVVNAMSEKDYQSHKDIIQGLTGHISALKGTGKEAMVAQELVRVAKDLMADVMSPFELALRRAIAAKVKEEKAAGTVSMSLENLMQVVRPPSSSLEGAPKGTNARYYYAEMFKDFVKDFRSFVKMAKDLTAIEFPTQDAYDKYMKEHPDADKSKHHVKKTKKEAPAKKEESEKKEWKPETDEERKKKETWLYKFEKLVRDGGGKMGQGGWTNAHMHYGQGLTPEEGAKKYLSWAPKEKKGSEIVAEELLAVAKDLMAMDFPSKDAMDKYLKNHPDADKSKHHVKETKKEAPVKKENAPLPEREDVENAFRDHLSQTNKIVTKESMMSVIKNQFKGITDIGFNNVWGNLIEEKYLVKTDGGYKWEV